MPSTTITTSSQTITPQVVELMEGWEFSESYEGTRGTRVFIDATALPSYTPVSLPLIGTSFSPDWVNITLKTIAMKYKSPRPKCPIIYTCQYDAKPLWTLVGQGSANPPPPVTNYSIGADYQTYTNPTQGAGLAPTWYYLNPDGSQNSPAVGVLIPQAEYITTISKTRYIYPGQDLTQWQNETKSLLGCINSAPMFDGCEHGTLLYIGAELTQMINESNVLTWKADMKFRYRFIPGFTTPPTWNYVFNPLTADYVLLGIPGETSADNIYLYNYADLNILLSSCLPPSTMGDNLPLGGLPPPSQLSGNVGNVGV